LKLDPRRKKPEVKGRGTAGEKKGGGQVEDTLGRKREMAKPNHQIPRTQQS